MIDNLDEERIISLYDGKLLAPGCYAFVGKGTLEYDGRKTGIQVAVKFSKLYVLMTDFCPI